MCSHSCSSDPCLLGRTNENEFTFPMSVSNHLPWQGKHCLWEVAKFLMWALNTWPSRKDSEATSWVTQTYFLSQLWTETKECEAFFLSLSQPWQGYWHSQRYPPLGVAARPLPSLQSTELLLSFLVNFFTFSFHNLKIARMKASFSKLFSPFFPFDNHLSDSCLIF